jgi:hypothetical protein
MTFVNSKLGNAFVIKSVDSPLDQEHYFANAYKHVRMKIKGVTFKAETVYTGGISVNDIKTDLSGNLWAAVHAEDGGSDLWFILRSSPDGDLGTWETEDLYAGPSTSAVPNTIVVDPKTDDIYVGGRQLVTGSEGINALIRKARRNTGFPPGPDGWTDFETVLNYNNANETDEVLGLATDRDDFAINVVQSEIHFCGYSTVGGVPYYMYAVSSTSGSTWGSVFVASGLGFESKMYSRGVDDKFGGGRTPVDGGYSLDTTPGVLQKFYLRAGGSTYDSYSEAAGYGNICYDVDYPFSSSWIAVGAISGTDQGGTQWLIRHRIQWGSGNKVNSYNHKKILKSEIPSPNFTNDEAHGQAWDIPLDHHKIDTFNGDPFPGGVETGLNSQSTGSIGLVVVGQHSSSYVESSDASWYVIRQTANDWEEFQAVDDYQIPGGTNVARNAVWNRGRFFVCGQLGGVGTIRRYTDSGEVEFVLTGSYKPRIELHMRLADANNVIHRHTGSFLERVFDYEIPTILTGTLGNSIPRTTGSLVERKEAVMTFYVSASAGTFDKTEFGVDFRDTTISGSQWSAYTNVNNLGQFSDVGDGWMKFEYNFMYGGVRENPLICVENNKTLWAVSASTNVYTFKDFEITYSEVLTTDGVEIYKEVDNQGNKDIFSYVKRGTMKGVE